MDEQQSRSNRRILSGRGYHNGIQPATVDAAGTGPNSRWYKPHYNAGILSFSHRDHEPPVLTDTLSSQLFPFDNYRKIPCEELDTDLHSWLINDTLKSIRCMRTSFSGSDTILAFVSLGRPSYVDNSPHFMDSRFTVIVFVLALQVRDIEKKKKRVPYLG